MQNHFDVIIVGGGAAGIMAALSCRKSHPHKSIAILDRTYALGRKILVCGAGRCNVTNLNLNSSARTHYYSSNMDLVETVFNNFNFEQIVEFFEELGVELYVERKTTVGKLFPVTDQAKTITAMLEDELHRLDIQILLEHDIEQIERKDSLFHISAVHKETPLSFTSQYLVLAAGGKTYSTLGANGSGYNLAQSLGHTIVEPVPSALPLVTKDKLCIESQGIKFEAEASSFINGQKIKTSTDDVMFTNYGISGPAILNISREISIRIHRNKKQDCVVKLNFFPSKSHAEISLLLKTRWQKRPDQSVEASLYGLFPNKFATVFLNTLKIDHKKPVSKLTPLEIATICTKLSSYEVQIDDTRSWNEAEFTAGGVNAMEVTPTLQSVKCPNLYLCGELLDVDGDVGGFNLSWAWSSGHLAGKLS